MPRRPQLAKLTRPQLRHALDRPRLFDALDASRTRPVVWLSGPPGAGKTTLVSTYIAARKHKHLWYDLDSGDADPASWFLHLREAGAVLRASNRRLPLFTDEYLAAPDVFTRRYFRALYRNMPENSLLVFDDHHEVPADAPFHELFALACEEVPEGVTIVVISREDPPPALAALRARERLSVLDGAALDLTADEASAIARPRFPSDEQAIRALHRAAQGWAAGFTLILDQPVASAAQAADTSSREAVFAYFAGIAMDGMDPADREALQLLSLVPRFTQDMARRLSGRPGIGAVIENMRKRRLFVYANGANGEWREFHALFRAFLLRNLYQAMTPHRVRQAASRAAALLARAGLDDEALAVYLDAERWRSAEALLLRTAERMMAEGRSRSLLAALYKMPDAVVERAPWLRYWRGRALLGHDPRAARADLDAASAAFEQRNDPLGQSLALAAWFQIELAVDHLQSGWADPAERLGRAIGAVRRWRSADHEALARGAWMFATFHLRPEHPEIRSAALRVAELVEQGHDTGVRARAAIQALIYAVCVGDFDLARRLLATLERLGRAEMTGPADRVVVLAYSAFAQYGLFLRFDEALAAIETAKGIAAEHGLGWAEVPVIQFEAEIHVYTNRDIAAGLAALERLKACGIAAGSVASVFFHCTATHAACWQNDPMRARDHAAAALAAAAVSSPAFVAMFGRWLIQAFADAGDLSTAKSLAGDTEARLAGTVFEASSMAVMSLQHAYLALVEGRRDEAHARLRNALAIMAADRSAEAPVYWLGRALSVLLGEALRHGIAPSVARDLIRRMGLPPVGRAGPEWPWPVAIRTLGRFELNRYGLPVSFGRKVPRKTLALLKLLIALGGTRVREAYLVDTLWPDEEGDAAHGAYTMAVVRLRRLLGDPRLLVQRDRMLSLDRRHCYVDLWDTDASPDARAVGAFLPDDMDEPWAEAVRQRLRRAARAAATAA